MAAVDISGKLVWNKNLGRPESTYGYASSLAIDQNRVIVQLDQGAAEDNLSKLIAIDGATGSVIWESKRPVRDSWTSPVVTQIGDSRQIITIADPWTIAYNPSDGKEIWRAEAVTGDVAPSPIIANGKVIAVEPYNQVVAIAANGAGDVSKTHVTPIGDDAIPDITSPVSDGKFLWMITTEGVLVCYDLGDPVPAPIDEAHKRNPRFRWDHEFRKDNFHASLSLVGDKLYILSAKGVMHIVAASDSFSEIGSNTLPDKFDATPAFADGKIILRGRSFLWCIHNQ
jgi:outer membrane protein assembly factor BamB